MKSKKRDNILVVAITRLGDMLQMSPTIIGLKEENPNAKITVVIDRQFASICSGIPGIDEVYVIDLSYVCRSLHREGDGVVEAFEYIQKAVSDLKEKKFDLALNMSNSAYTALLIKMLNIEDNRGWLSDEEGFRLMADPWAMLFAAFVYHSNRDYNSLNLVDIFRCAADVQKHPEHLCYIIPEEALARTDDFLTQEGLGTEGPLICIQAGASQEKRQWAPSHFAFLARLLVEKLSARIVWTGTLSEKPIIDKIMAEYSSPKTISAIGKTNFNSLAALLKKSDLLITGDTGPMHLSVAVGTPVVALFLASALCFETGPYSTGNFVIQPQISCCPCNPNYPCNRPDCHAQITPELVAYIAELRLKTPMGTENNISIPNTIADPNSVAVFCTDFDQDGFLNFFPLTEVVSRHAEPKGYYEAARQAYRVLWKEEFANIPYKEATVVKSAKQSSHPSLDGVSKTLELCEQGVKEVNYLISLIADVTSKPSLLSEANSRIQEIDKKVEMTCLEYPIIGAITRIFIMEKENLRGHSAMQLATDTIKFYERLQRRCNRFKELFQYFYASN